MQLATYINTTTNSFNKNQQQRIHDRSQRRQQSQPYQRRNRFDQQTTNRQFRNKCRLHPPGIHEWADCTLNPPITILVQRHASTTTIRTISAQCEEAKTLPTTTIQRISAQSSEEAQTMPRTTIRTISAQYSEEAQRVPTVRDAYRQTQNQTKQSYSTHNQTKQSYSTQTYYSRQQYHHFSQVSATATNSFQPAPLALPPSFRISQYLHHHSTALDVLSTFFFLISSTLDCYINIAPNTGNLLSFLLFLQLLLDIAPNTVNPIDYAHVALFQQHTPGFMLLNMQNPQRYPLIRFENHNLLCYRSLPQPGIQPKLQIYLPPPLLLPRYHRVTGHARKQRL